MYLRIGKLLLLAVFLIGCGKASNPIEQPVEETFPSFAYSDYQHGTRRPMYTSTLAIDTASGSVSVLDGRGIESHWDVTRMLNPPSCVDCIGIKVLDFQPDSDFIKVEVTLTNPTSLTGYDVRGIMMTNVDGFMLVNADGFTDLWDDGGDVALNPFKAYAVDQPQREFVGYAQYSRIYAIRYPSVPDLLALDLVVDVSWPGNCEEPYFLGNINQSAPLMNDGASVDVEVTVRDWQSDVSVVAIDLSPIGGTVSSLAQISDWIWGGSIAASAGTEPGLYMLKAAAKSAGSDLKLRNFLPVIVEPVPGTPSAGPVWTDTIEIPGEFWDVDVEGDYAYVAAGAAGLVVVDLTTDPPSIVNSYMTGKYAKSIGVSGSYAYLGTSSRFEVFDISDPENPVYLHISDGFTPVLCQIIDGDRLYAWDISYDYVYIHELDTLGGIEYIGQYYVYSQHTADVKVSGNLLYIAAEKRGLLIVDTTDPLHPELLTEFDPDDDYTNGFTAYRLALRNDLLYVYMNGTLHLVTLDVSDPADPQAVDNCEGIFYESCFVDDMLFGAFGYNGLTGIDVSTPDHPQLKCGAGVGDFAFRIDVTEDQSTAILGTMMYGLQFVDLTNTGGLLGIQQFYYRVSRIGGGIPIGQYMYATGYYGTDSAYGLIVTGLDSPSSDLVSFVPGRGLPAEMESYGNYLIAGDSFAGINIFDISIADSPVQVGTCDIGAQISGTARRDDVIYVACDLDGVMALDISEPEEPTELWCLSLAGDARGVEIIGDYLYVQCGKTGIIVIDVTDPENPVSVATLDTPGVANDVCFNGGYAYVADQNEGLALCDATDPGSPVYIKSMELPGLARRVNCVDGLLYVGCDEAGVQVLSLADPVNPVLHCSADFFRPVFEGLPYGDNVFAFNESGIERFAMQ